MSAWCGTFIDTQDLKVTELRALLDLVDTRKGPVANCDGDLVGVGAVVDKNRTSALVAHAVDAELLVLATDVDAVYEGWCAFATTRACRAMIGSLTDIPRLVQGSAGTVIDMD